MRNLMSLVVVAAVALLATPYANAQCNCGGQVYGGPIYGAPAAPMAPMASAPISYGTPIYGSPAMSSPAIYGTPIGTPMYSAPMDYGMNYGTPIMDSGTVLSTPMEQPISADVAAPIDSGSVVMETPMVDNAMENVPMDGTSTVIQGAPMEMAQPFPAGGVIYDGGSFGGNMMNTYSNGYGSIGSVFIDSQGLQGTIISDTVISEGDAVISEGAAEVQEGTGEATTPVPDATTTPMTEASGDSEVQPPSPDNSATEGSSTK